MNKIKPFSHHHVWLSVLFILGSGIINLPFAFADRLTFLGFVVAFLLAILLVFIVYEFKVMKIPIVICALYLAADTFVVFIEFIAETLLGKGSNFWILMLFVVPLFYFCFRKSSEILNFSLICGVICGLLLIFFFFSTLKDFNVKNVYIYHFPNLRDLFRQTVPYVKNVTLPAGVLALFARQEKTKKSVATAGVCVGGLFLLVSIFNSILLFGTELAGELDYPYASAISTVTFGNLFFRLDGFSYFIYFATAIVKIAVCVAVVKREFKNFSL